MASLITLAILALLVFVVIGIFNKLVALKNRYQNAFAQIEVQLKRRYDLIPNLVETAKGYLKHERETLEAVIAARNTAISGLKLASNNPGDASAMNELSGAETALHGAMNRLSVVMEAYPDLKANLLYSVTASLNAWRAKAKRFSVVANSSDTCSMFSFALRSG